MDSINFATINEVPFLFATQEEVYPKYAFYKDSLPDNQNTYYYRVSGRTSFGTHGPSSAIVSVKGVPARLPLFLTIDGFEAENTAIRLDWSGLSDSLNSQLQGFNIYRSTQVNRDFEQLNTTLLGNSERTFVDPAPLPMAYYRLEPKK